MLARFCEQCGKPQTGCRKLNVANCLESCRVFAIIEGPPHRAVAATPVIAIFSNCSTMEARNGEQSFPALQFASVKSQATRVWCSPKILRMTLSARVSKYRPWLSKIRSGCHAWIFWSAAFAFRR